MNTEYFDGNDVLGFELKSVQDVINALNLGLDIMNENEEYLNATREDEDGNERPATTDDIIEDAQTAFRVGGKIYATFNIPLNKELVPFKATNLQSSFRVGQSVFAMRDNKIIEGEIVLLTLTQSKDRDKFFTDFRSNSLGESVFHIVASGINPNFTNYYSLDNRAFLEDKLKRALNDNQVLLCVDKKYYSYGLDEVFATKEKLIKHLMEE